MVPNSDLGHLLVTQAVEYAILLIRTDGKIALCSPGIRQIFGIEPADLVDRPLAELYAEADRESSGAALNQSEQQGSYSEIRKIRLQSRSIWVEESTTALRDSDGSLAGYGRIIRDVTALRQAEATVTRANEELHQFAFTVSHDLQEPLRTVRSYAELLARRYKEQLDSDANDFINFIVDGASRMARLLKDLLAYSQAGRPDRTRPERTEVDAVLQWAIMNLSNEIKNSEARITHDRLPAINVDQAQLATVFQQIIDNAIKFRSDAPPQLHVSADREENLWRFSIRDNGQGMNPQFTERAFGVFKRMVGKDVPGTGIGLAVCRKIIEAHGGEMWLESEEGKGSTVHFTLPAED